MVGAEKSVDKGTEAKDAPSRARGATHQSLSGGPQTIFGFAGVQQNAGNLAIQRLFNSGLIQAKLSISQPDDPYEQEADRVAEQVMLMPDLSQAQSKRVSRHDKFQSLQRMSTEREDEVHRQPMEEEEEVIQTKEVSGGAPEVTPSIESQINSVRGGGQSLPESVRAFFEPRFGQDFSQVRVHTDSRTAETANSIHAKAFTVGFNIAFGTGQYAPGSHAGRQVLAHELTHVVQQNGSQLQRAQPRATGQVPQAAPSLEPDAEMKGGAKTPGKDLSGSGVNSGELARCVLGQGKVLCRRPDDRGTSREGRLNLLPTDLRGEFDRRLLWPALLSSRLVDLLWTLDPGFGPLMSHLANTAMSGVLRRFPLVPAHFGPTLRWFQNSRQLKSQANDAGQLLAADDSLLTHSLRQLGQSLHGLFSGNWKHFADAMSATHQTFVWFNSQVSGTFSGLGAEAGFPAIGEAIDALASELRANAGTLDKNTLVLEEVAKSLGCDQTVRTTSDLVAWVELQKKVHLYGPVQLRKLATDLVLSLDFVEPLQTLVDFGKDTVGLQNLLVEAADALDDPDSVPDDAQLFRTLLPRLRTSTVLLAEAISNAAMWPATFAVGLLRGADAWVKTLQFWGDNRHTWLAGVAREISEWVDTIFDRSIEIITRVFTQSSVWLGKIEQLFVAMEPAMADENTKEIKPSLLIRALRRLGVPEELLEKIQQSAHALGKVVRHPFKFFKNLAKAIVNGLYNFVGNIGTHLMGALANWIFSELDIPWQGPFSLPKALGLLATLIRLTFDHFLDVLEKKHPGAGEKVRQALKTGALAVRWVRLLFDKKYGELWAELKAYLYNFWSEFVISVQKLLLNEIMSKGVNLLIGFLTPGLRQAVKIVREIYRAIKQFKAQAQRILGVVNSVCTWLGDIVDEKLEPTIKLVEESAVRILRWAVRFFADWVGLGDVPKKIREAVEKIRGLVDRAFEELIEFTREIWEWVKQEAAKVKEWWLNRSAFQNAAGEVHELFFKGKDTEAVLKIKTDERVLDEYLDNEFKNPTDDEKPIIAQIRSHATKIANIREKSYVSQEDSETIYEHFKKIAGLLARLGRAEAVPPTQVEWKRINEKRPGSPWDDGAYMKADPLSLDPGSNVGSEPYEESKLWKKVKRRKGTYVQGHLLNHNIGGPGSTKNLIPITIGANNNMKDFVETHVKKAVQHQKKVMRYEVNMTFGQPSRQHIPEEGDLPEYIEMRVTELQKNGSEWEPVPGKSPLARAKIPHKLPQDDPPPT